MERMLRYIMKKIIRGLTKIELESPDVLLDQMLFQSQYIFVLGISQVALNL